MERVKSTKGTSTGRTPAAGPNEANRPKRETVPVPGTQKLSDQYGKPIGAGVTLGGVRLHYRSKACGVPGFSEARRYYAGLLQIAYVHIGPDKCVAHVVDNLRVQTVHEVESPAKVLKLLGDLLQEAPE